MGKGNTIPSNKVYNFILIRTYIATWLFFYGMLINSNCLKTAIFKFYLVLHEHNHNPRIYPTPPMTCLGKNEIIKIFCPRQQSLSQMSWKGIALSNWSSLRRNFVHWLTAMITQDKENTFFSSDISCSFGSHTFLYVSRYL